MENENVESNPSPTLPFFLFGFVVFVIGPVGFFAQMQIGWLIVPWYLLILKTFGVLLIAVSVVQNGGWLRYVGIAPFVVATGFIWYVMIVASPLAPYDGPAQVGEKLPAFSAKLAGGEQITRSYFEPANNDGKRSIMLFYRGRW